jgi:hypothetical protein
MLYHQDIWWKCDDVSEIFASFNIRAMMEAGASLKRRQASTRVHGTAAQKTAIFKFAAVRT